MIAVRAILAVLSTPQRRVVGGWFMRGAPREIGSAQLGQRLDDEFVVLALWEPRHGRHPDAADAVDHDRETAAMAGDITFGESPSRRGSNNRRGCASSPTA